MSAVGFDVYGGQRAYLVESLSLRNRLVVRRTAVWPVDATEVPELPGTLVFASNNGDSSERVFWLPLGDNNERQSLVSIKVGDGEARATALATTDAECVVSLEKIRDIFPASVIAAGQVRATFWTLGDNGPQSNVRTLDVPSFDEVAANYTTRTRDGLARLIGTQFSSTHGGKLILWHGDAGTGKTFALRALLKAWKEWASLHYIVDPEQFFGTNAAYMTSVLLGEAPSGTWRVMVLEDTGELLTRDAKERSGQGLSRLLNVCDGLIGQGLRVLVLITTNENLGSMHPAVTRPGRCLSNVAFGHLTHEEALAWLSERGFTASAVDSGGATIAELFAISEGRQVSTNRPRRVGIGA